MKEKTIAAISTPPGRGGISIVRMSGEDSFDIIKRIFVPFSGKDLDKDKDNRRMRFGHIVRDTEVLDEVMVTFMKGPATYTREDICEINCHGSYVSVKNILSLLLDSGAVLAERGEFTKRAFLNGRIDLSQAEAVLDIINARDDISQKEGLNQLSGSLREAIDDVRKSELEALSRIEYSINFTEDGQDLPVDMIIDYMIDAKEKIDKLLNTSNKGKIIRDGIDTTIIGKPNVGKSSLLNALLRENRAIVTDVPGTTRDSISEYISFGDLSLKINDTAGIRETEDVVEKIGVDKSKELAKTSDLILALFDLSRELDEEDLEIIDLLKDKNSIIILNKTDLNQAFDKDELAEIIKKTGADIPIIEASMINKEGIEELENLVSNIFETKDLEKEPVVITNLRHQKLLKSASEKLNNSLKDIKNLVPIDCIEVDLRSSYNDLGLIIGQAVSDEIMDKVFKEFCVGK